MATAKNTVVETVTENVVEPAVEVVETAVQKIPLDPSMIALGVVAGAAVTLGGYYVVKYFKARKETQDGLAEVE